MESIPPEIISYIGSFLDVASASTLEHVLYKQPFKRMAGSDIVFNGFENFKLWSRYVDPNEICVAIAKHGTFEMFKWAVDRFPLDHVDCLMATLKSNNLKIARMVVPIASRMCCNSLIVDTAVQYSRIGILHLLLTNDIQFNWWAYASAARAKRIDVLDWLVTINCVKNDCIIDNAIYSGDKNIVNWCHEMNCEWNPLAWDVAVKKCDIPMIEHLISLGYNILHLNTAIARSDDPVLLKWAAVNLQ